MAGPGGYREERGRGGYPSPASLVEMDLMRESASRCPHSLTSTSDVGECVMLVDVNEWSEGRVSGRSVP